jgi:hypothetical protein
VKRWSFCVLVQNGSYKVIAPDEFRYSQFSGKGGFPQNAGIASSMFMYDSEETNK